ETPGSGTSTRPKGESGETALHAHVRGFATQSRQGLRRHRGLVNNGLAARGIEPVAWLSSPAPAFWGICIAIAWKSSSFMPLVLLAGCRRFQNRSTKPP